MTRTLKAVDLFAGAGGLSCGFSQAGFEIPLAIEHDLWASETYAQNHLGTKLITRNICEVTEEELSEYRGVDIVMGGPPCQGFSISASSRRKKDDPRNLLYLEFIRAVKAINPKAVLIENVKEMARFRLPDGRLLCDDIKARLNELGYSSELIIVNASKFGVPQARFRAFIIGSKDSSALHSVIQNIKITNEFSDQTLSLRNEGPISLWDAISDLPPVEPWKVEEDAISKYKYKPKNSFQISMRENSIEIFNHVPMKHTPRMIERFRHLIENSSNDLLPLPAELSPRTRGNSEITSDKKYDQNHRRLDPHKPSPTITASFYSSFIHPYQPRNLTVREAARLQSFPDTFIFKGKRTTLSKKLLARKGIFEDLSLDQFNQVGNSVPPILAKKLAQQINLLVK